MIYSSTILQYFDTQLLMKLIFITNDKIISNINIFYRNIVNVMTIFT